MTLVKFFKGLYNMSLINTAYAAGTSAPASAQSTFMSFLPMVVIFILFWFLLIRPQQKKTKAHNNMISELKSGNEVITNSGIIGKITKVVDQFIVLEIADNTLITIQKSSIAGKVEDGTYGKVR